MLLMLSLPIAAAVETKLKAANVPEETCVLVRRTIFDAFVALESDLNKVEEGLDVSNSKLATMLDVEKQQDK